MLYILQDKIKNHPHQAQKHNYDQRQAETWEKICFTQLQTFRLFLDRQHLFAMLEKNGGRIQSSQ